MSTPTPEAAAAEAAATPSWPGWCCSYCGAPLHADGHGVSCARENRWFATSNGVHRLLTQERRRELQPALEAWQRVRRDEGWDAGAGRRRARHLARAMRLAAERLGRGPWRVLDVGAGGCWASARLLAAGHAVAAVDVDLDPEDGLGAAGRLLDDPSRLPRAEADMESLPLEPASMDLVLAAGVLHHAARPARALLEMRRVTRRGGLLVVLDSPVYRRVVDGETVTAEHAARLSRRYRFPATPFGAGFLVLPELDALFQGAGWRLETYGWPGPLAEAASDLLSRARGRTSAARFPILIGRRDG